MNDLEKFDYAVKWFESISHNDKYPSNPFSPIERYSSLQIGYHFNMYSDFPAIQFWLHQAFRQTGTVLHREILNCETKEDIEEVLRRHVDRKAKNIYRMMYRQGDVHLNIKKYFQEV